MINAILWIIMWTMMYFGPASGNEAISRALVFAASALSLLVLALIGLMVLGGFLAALVGKKILTPEYVKSFRRPKWKRWLGLVLNTAFCLTLAAYGMPWVAALWMFTYAVRSIYGVFVVAYADQEAARAS